MRVTRMDCIDLTPHIVDRFPRVADSPLPDVAAHREFLDVAVTVTARLTRANADGVVPGLLAPLATGQRADAF